MSTRLNNGAALAKAEAELQRAKDDLDQAHARRTVANAAWDNLVNDRRRAGSDRRKAGTVWNGPFPDRRVATGDRRSADAIALAFAKVVADQHTLYIERSNAEADWVAATVRLDSASAERDKAKSAADALNGAQNSDLS